MTNTYLFKITLAHSKPAIWRTFKVDGNYRLDRFHQVIQLVMGWWNAHLHEFVIEQGKYGMLLDDMYDFPELANETTVYLKQFSLKKGAKMYYLYDFGDNWEHHLELIDIEDLPLDVPICTGGEGACPPEDCGGVWGYSDMRQIIKDPKHPKYEDWIDWMPQGFDPDVFLIEEVNKELKKFGAWHKKHPRKKSTPWHQI